MIAKIAVSAATFAIDKPYSYAVAEEMALQSGQRVTVPFGRGNRRCEGVVLSMEAGSPEGLKTVEKVLDECPVVTPLMLRLAAFIRERYFCTFYEAIRVMLPAGLWFQTKESFVLTEDRSWKEKTIKNADAVAILRLMEDLGGQAEEEKLRAAVSDDAAFETAVQYLLRKKWITAEAEHLRRLGDKTERIATLASSPEEAMEYAAHRPKSAAMQRAVLELMCSFGSVAVKELRRSTVWKNWVISPCLSVRFCVAGRSALRNWMDRWYWTKSSRLLSKGLTPSESRICPVQRCSTA